MRVISFGDSLTYGSIGYSYVKYLKHNKNLIIKNKGVNGDTTIQMFRRLKRFVDRTNFETPDTYIICIGGNDLLLPYLSSVSFLWHMQMKARIKTMHCITENKLFEKYYCDIIKCVLSKGHKLIIVGLPYLELKGFPNSKINTRNEILKQLAAKYTIPFVDTTSIQMKLSSKDIGQYSWKNKNVLRILEGIVFPLFPPLKDILSKVRHLSFTDDGVHWNSILSKAVSKEIEKYLIGIE